MSAYDDMVTEYAGGGVFEVVGGRARRRVGTVMMRGIQLQLAARYRRRSRADAAVKGDRVMLEQMLVSLKSGDYVTFFQGLRRGYRS
jgi:hypothetical protein